MSSIMLGGPAGPRTMPVIDQVDVDSVTPIKNLDNTGRPAWKLIVSVRAGGQVVRENLEMWVIKGPQVDGASKDLVDKFSPVPSAQRTRVTDIVGLASPRPQVDGAFALFHAEMVKAGEPLDKALAGMIAAAMVPAALTPTVV